MSDPRLLTAIHKSFTSLSHIYATHVSTSALYPILQGSVLLELQRLSEGGLIAASPVPLLDHLGHSPVCVMKQPDASTVCDF